MPFIPGESYTRDHIHEILGGEKVSYLPQKEGKIVCGCFSTDANPEAPYVILVGGDEDGEEHTVERKAKILEAQDEAIPVFLKRASNDWVYEGNFKVQHVTRDRQFLEEKKRQAGRVDVVMALIMEPVETSALHRARERWLRDEKIVQVKRANGGWLPCEACKVDFFEVYGEIGRDYAQVHHLKSLSDRTKPSLTKLSDLAVVCANCHVMVHRGGQMRPLERLLAT